MSLSPHNEDKDKERVKADVEKLKSKGTTQAADELKEKHNINVGKKANPPKSRWKR